MPDATRTTTSLALRPDVAIGTVQPGAGQLTTATVWTQQDVAAFLKVSVRTVQRLDIPATPIVVAEGKDARPLLRYDPADVYAWWETQKDAARVARLASPAARVASRAPAMRPAPSRRRRAIRLTAGE